MNEQETKKALDEAKSVMEEARKVLNATVAQQMPSPAQEETQEAAAQEITAEPQDEPTAQETDEPAAENTAAPEASAEPVVPQKTNEPQQTVKPAESAAPEAQPVRAPEASATEIPAPAGKVIPKKKNKAKIIVPIAVVGTLVIAAAIFAAIFFLNRNIVDDDYLSDDFDPGYVDFEVSNRYTGVVEPQKTSTVNRDPDRSVGKLYVSVGDEIKKGDKLFSYDEEEAKMKLQQAKIEYDGINNEITGYNNHITELTNQRAKAEEDQQLEYTIQIQEYESYKAQSQLSLKKKQVEIDNLEKSVKNADVFSPIDGIIKQISDNASLDYNSSDGYITILMTGAYQVKGKVDELNVGSLYEGMPVIIHSRADQSKTWDGVISKIDTESSADNSSGDVYYESDSDERATKYYFYATLDASDDLLLGQHVFIEPVFDGDDETFDEAIFDDEALTGGDAADTAEG